VYAEFEYLGIVECALRRLMVCGIGVMNERLKVNKLGFCVNTNCGTLVCELYILLGGICGGGCCGGIRQFVRKEKLERWQWSI